MRHCTLIEVALDGAVGRRPERIEQASDSVLLDQAAHLLKRLRRAEAVVVAEEDDAAAGDATLLVDHSEELLVAAADHAVGAGWPAVRHGVADADLGRCDARHILGPSDGVDRQGACRCGEDLPALKHIVLPFAPKCSSPAPAKFRTGRRRWPAKGGGVPLGALPPVLAFAGCLEPRCAACAFAAGRGNHCLPAGSFPLSGLRSRTVAQHTFMTKPSRMFSRGARP